MNVFRCLLFGGICSAFGAGCGSSVDRSAIESGEVITVSYEHKPFERFETDRYFSDISIVPLETNEKSLISNIRTMDLLDSLVFIRDDNRLLLFNSHGKFISQIGRSGRGPGEYIGLQGFFVDKNNKTVTVIDHMKRLLLTYGFDGLFLSSSEIPAQSFNWGNYAMLVNDDKVLVANSHNPDHNMAYTSMDLNNPEQAEYFLTYDPIRIKNYSYDFAKHSMTRSGDDLHFTMQLDPQIYEYSNGNVSVKYRIETPLEMIPKKLMQRTEGSNSAQLLQLTTIRGHYFGGFTDIFETDRLIFMHYWAKNAFPGVFVLDKSSSVGHYYLFPSEENTLTDAVFPFSASDGNRLVSVVPYYKIQMLKESVANNEVDQDRIAVDLRNALNSTNDDSNPLLVFYELKP